MGLRLKKSYKISSAITAVLVIFTAFPLAADNLSLTLNISGTVAKRCALGGLPGATVNLAFGQTTQLDFTFDCNTPFSYTLSSSHGGLLNDHAADIAPGSDPFTTLALYGVELNVPLQQGDTAQIHNQCNSDTLTAGSQGCSFSDSGSAIAIQQAATLKITPASQEGQVLLAGSYGDILTLEVTAK